MSTQVHAVAEAGFGTGTNELYDRVRPSYPRDTIRFIKKAANTQGPLNVVEIGAGTGLFTRALMADNDGDIKVASLKAIEPSAGMRDVFKQKVVHEAVSISEGTFESVPTVTDGWADLIIIAQAFHWCLDYGKACTEFARILKPDGTVALIWNMGDRNAASWVAQLHNCVEAHENGTPQSRLGLWRQVFSTKEYRNTFEPPEEKEWAYHLVASEDTCIDRALSNSYISILPHDVKERVIGTIKATIAKGDGKVWIDETKGEFEYPYKTLVVLSRKK